MRIIRSLVAIGAGAAAVTALAVAPAMAEPINTHGKLVTPKAYDIVGVGSESITYLVDQLTYNYNLTVKHNTPSTPYIYSWDAVPPNNLNNTTQQIVVKAGCKKNLRPNGSGAGISALTSGYGNTSYTTTVKGKKHKHTVPCIDFARSSRPRKTSDPVFGPTGIAFVTLAQDAVTYATTANSNVPENLTKSQLAEIFTCSVPAATYGSTTYAANTWGALLGPTAKAPTDTIDPILPQAGSGTLSFWMNTALGDTTYTSGEPGCGTAADLTAASQQPEENEGTSSVFLLDGKPNPDVIFPFSIGAYVAEKYNSKTCGKSVKKGQNKFGCNETGVLNLDSIGGLAPIIVKNGVHETNPAWNNTPFRRFLYDVVRYANTKDHIPAYLEKYFGRKGYFCKQTKVIKAYGFETTGLCGIAS